MFIEMPGSGKRTLEEVSLWHEPGLSRKYNPKNDIFFQQLLRSIFEY